MVGALCARRHAAAMCWRRSTRQSCRRSSPSRCRTRSSKQMIKAVPECVDRGCRAWNAAETAYWKKVTEEVKVELPDNEPHPETRRSMPIRACRARMAPDEVDERSSVKPSLSRCLRSSTDREGRRRADARRRAAQGRRVPAGRRRQVSRPSSISGRTRRTSSGFRRRHAGGKAEPLHELGDRQPGMVGAARLCRRAGRRPRQRQVAGPVRAVVARRGGRFLRRHRMGGGAAVVQRQGRAVRHFVFRHQPVVRRQPAAAVA